MLTPSDVEALANSITDIYAGVEKECVSSIVQHITAGKRITQASVWQMNKLNEIGQLRRDLVSAVKKQTGKTFQEVEGLLMEGLARSTGVDYGRLVYAMRAGNFKDNIGKKAEFIKYIQSTDGFKKVLKSATAGCRDILNMTGTKAIQASVKAYADAINFAYLDMISGNYTFEEAVTRAVGNIGKSGIKIVDSKDKATNGQMVEKVKGGEKFTTYASKNGVRVYPLDSAIRRDLTTTINRACGNLTLETCSEMKAELVETSWHVGARPEHEVWQGRIFSLDPNDTRYPYFYAPQEQGGTGYGDMLGLCGINCYHSFSPYFEGSPRSTQENKPTKAENDKAYKEQQTQRAYERSLRSLKREQMAYQQAGLTAEAQDAQRRVNDMSHRYKQFLSQTGRTRVTMLDKVSGYRRISTKTGATVPQPTALTQPVVRHRTTTAKHVAPTPQERFDKAKRFDFTDPISRTGGDSYQIAKDAHEYHSINNFDENIWNSLSYDEQSAVQSYTGSSYRTMNDALWAENPKMHGDYVEKKINNCLSAINHFEIKEDVICYRGACSYSQFAQQFNLVADDLRSEAVRNSLTGQLWQEKGFTSLAGNRTSAWSKNIKLEICVPKGTKGLYVSAKGKAVSSMGEGERELLINPSSMQILGNYYDSTGQLWFKVCIVKQP